jgi:hypothetical protein
MAIEVFPTANDIGGSGTGRTATEENMVQTLDRFSSPSSILSGMVPSAGTGLAVDVAAGRCQIDGYLVRFTATEAVTVTASETDDYLWLQLTGAGDSPPAVTATAWVETNDLSSPPANAALVAKFTTSGSAVTAIADDERREGCGFITGTYTGDGTSFQSISLGLTPSFVRISHPLVDPDAANWARSKVWPGNMALPTLVGHSATDILIEKDGFTVAGSSGTPSVEFNVNTYVYSYIAWF